MKILVNNNNVDYGIVGDVTDMTYKNGDPMQVGDIVHIVDCSKFAYVVKCDNEYFVMGLMGSNIELGFSGIWEVDLVDKFYNIKDNREVDCITLINKPTFKIITIDGKDIKISIESFNELIKIDFEEIDKTMDYFNERGIKINDSFYTIDILTKSGYAWYCYKDDIICKLIASRNVKIFKYESEVIRELANCNWYNEF